MAYPTRNTATYALANRSDKSKILLEQGTTDALLMEDGFYLILDILDNGTGIFYSLASRNTTSYP